MKEQLQEILSFLNDVSIGSYPGAKRHGEVIKMVNGLIEKENNTKESINNNAYNYIDKLGFNYPNGTRYKWDNIEIAGCKDNDGSIYRVDESDNEIPDFYTVYLHLTEGGTMAVADLPTEKLAQDCAEMLHNAVISFKDNGFLPLSRNAELHRKFNLLLDEKIKMASSVQTKAAYEIVKDQFNSLIKP